MKKNKFIYLVLPCFLILLTTVVVAQEDSVVTEEVVKLKYYTENNSMQYVVVENLLKTGKKTQPLKNRTFQLYLDSATADNLISKITTDNSGKAKSFIPASLKAKWELKAVQKFIAVPSGKEEELTEIIITKAKIKMDTASAEGIRSITVQVMKYENDDWMPAKDVEMKVGIQRHSSILTAGEEETYTTDSTGTVIVVLKNDSMPGDTKGNMILIAKIEDNDEFGNLMIEKTVPWGVSVTTDTNFFNQRTLWSTRFRTPLWLLFMAYSIVFVVWGAIIYLVLQIIKIKKLGKSLS